ncbi:hypothetical protein PAXRUDRAFT_824832 [Paxillus rubicundulus Ve08.2h10]|uniref:Uncharacterized protein n=1 Tax=Paxillus rubicundulus Ve08.2h10 TaxID=930991 RepID=A0A0D0E1A9_9AGAM|nr:hypothetical protein PAXRUDRAFT_824832 [Paxillus rubicundulus Ve08.2h10]
MSQDAVNVAALADKYVDFPPNTRTESPTQKVMVPALASGPLGTQREEQPQSYLHV